MIDKVSIPTFLINYTPYNERKLNALNVLNRSGISSVKVVGCWDKENISPLILNNINIWVDRVTLISDILYFNALDSKDRDKFLPNDFSQFRRDIYNNCLWMHHRQLSRGEVSVCLKHFYAISSVACGDGPFGLVVEDDIGHLDTSNAELKTILNECYRFNIDFADIVGGCMLEPTRHEMQNKHISTNLCKINPSRTRTLAGYILSKNFAIDIVNSFFPLVMPIDWHIQYIMSESTNINAYWATRPVFTHGSEIGLFDSWRK